MNKKIDFFALLLVAFLAAPGAWPAPALDFEDIISPRENREEVPEVIGDDWTEITCDGNMLINYREGWVRFFRNVRVRNQRGTILSDLLVIFTQDSGKKVERAEARGNVRILTEGREGTGDALIYYPEEKKAVLVGNAVLREGNNSVSGRSITYNFRTGNVEIDRARDIEFHPRTEFELEF